MSLNKNSIVRGGNLNTHFVSVIIPVYNDQMGIDACLAALSKQTWPSECYEVIVVDNGSSPPIEVASCYNGFARLAKCTTPGAYAARNKGIADAHGDILAFTDADCVPSDNWIESGIAALKRGGNACIIGGEVVLSISQRPTAVELYQYLAGFMQRENIEQRGFSATANIFVTRKSIDMIGGFSENLLSGGDREWCWRASKHGIPTNFAPGVKVASFPRNSLSSAIRQARRVAGGRYELERLAAEHVSASNIKPHRSNWSAIKWIFLHTELTVPNKVKVFSVALVIKFVAILEKIKLKCGENAERR